MILTFDSLLVLAAAKNYSLLCQQSVAVEQRYRLEFLLCQLAFTIEKDLRRVAHYTGQYAGHALLIDCAPYEAVASCVIVAYDINRSAQWASIDDNAGYFGYRLRQGSLER